MAERRTSGNIDIQGGDGAEKHYHPCSREAKKIKLPDQPWYRPGITRKQSDDYLASTPPGAFVVRPAAAGDSHVMDVQAGPRIGHVLLSHITIDSITYFHLPGTPHYFEHLFDLVMFCHYNPFIFEKIDGKIVITLSIAMAKKAEKINVKRKKQKEEDDKAAAKLNAQRQADEAAEAKAAEEERLRREAEAEKARKKAEEEAEKARKKAEEEAEKARKKAEEEAARLAAEQEKARKKAEEDARKAQEEAARRAAEEEKERLRKEAEEKARQERAAREAEEKARFEAEALARREAEERKREEEERKKREAEQLRREQEEKRREAAEIARKEAEEKRRLAEEKARAAREAEEQARNEFESKARRKSEAATRLADQERERLMALEAARLAEQEKDAEERAARLEAMKKQREERDAEESRKRAEEHQRIQQEQAALAAAAVPAPRASNDGGVLNDMSDYFRSRFVAAKRPAHVKKVKAEVNHPYHVHQCEHCPDATCEEGFKYNKFKPTKCGNCTHTHDLRDPPPMPPPAPVVEPVKEEKKQSLGMRFFPGGKASSKIAELQGQLQGTPAAAPQPKKKEEKKEAKRESKKEAKRKTSDLRQKVGMNPAFALEDVMDDPFKDPYVLVPVDEPHDGNHTAAVARVELELRLIANALTSLGGNPSKKAAEENLSRLDDLERQLNAESAFEESNDDGILEAMSRTNPAAYQAVMEERAAQAAERDNHLLNLREQITDLRSRFTGRA
eukprot:m.236246 g.236246  ORF g.236246 m.236246 type:complete len:738 (-) comp20502_c0_seq1:110-2323(-)